MLYLLLKLIHILSATLLFGTGLGSAFYFWRANQSQDTRAMFFAARNVVIADWVFTTPAVIIQPITGFALMHMMGIPLLTPWIMLSLMLYIFTGLCWLPVVWLQMQMHSQLALVLANGGHLPTLYYRYYCWWFWLGVPAFISVVIIYCLMVFKM